MGKVMLFTDCVGEEFEIRHIVKVSKRGYGIKHYETNDGTFYSHAELVANEPRLKDYLVVGDTLATRVSDGTTIACKLSHLNLALDYEGLPDYNHSKYITPTKPLPKGL